MVKNSAMFLAVLDQCCPGSLRSAATSLENLKQSAFHRLEEKCQDTIAPRKGHRLMELHVSPVKGPSARLVTAILGHGVGRLPHGDKGGIHRGEPGPAGVSASQCHGLDLQGPTHVHQIECGSRIRMDQRAKEGVEHGAVGLPDGCPSSPGKADDALTGQYFKSFPHGDTAHLELRGKFRFRRQTCSDVELADDLR